MDAAARVKILLVEDEAVLRQGLADLLEGAGHAVTPVGDGATAVQLGLERDLELVVLDLALPALDGLEVCRRLRVARPELLVLMLTARGTEEDKVRGLSIGADDYLTKPFGARELLARVEALGRRVRPAADEAERIEVDGCVLDLGRCTAVRADMPAPVALTARESRLLRVLWQSRARALTRAELLERVWGTSGDLQTRTVDMTVANLRQKIERDPAAPRILTTVKGVGYAWGAA